MSEIWHPQPVEVIRQWIKDILTEASDELNDWEQQFIESVEQRNSRGQDLSQKQQDILERIYAEKTK